MAELPKPHGGMTPEEKGELLLRYVAEGQLVRDLDFRRSKIEDADLSAANLKGANLELANLAGASLEKANLEKANLELANLELANLAGANLRSAQLGRAHLFGANLKGAYLKEANLFGAYLAGAYLAGAKLEGTNLKGADLELAHLINLPVVPISILGAQSLDGTTVDWRTVARMLTLPDPVHLLCRTGMPHVTATYMVDSLRSIDATDLFTMLQTVFLSYGRPDAEFAERLRNELTENGVKTWYFPRDAVPGERIHRSIEREVGRFERMVLCCSKASLVRPGVLHEVETVIERERDESMSDVLIPVLLEDIFESGRTPPDWWPENKVDVYNTLRRRVCADFREAVYDVVKWNEELGKLLKALRKRPEGDAS
ncbi:MAG: toll/interleukin-1 receptor domain-containing protein [Myxococcota bacterium]